MQWHLRHPKLLGSGRRVQATRSHHSNETTCDRVLVGTSLAHYGESLTSHPVNSHIRSKSRRSVTTETPRRWAKGRLAPVSASRPVSTIRHHISLDRVVGDSVARSRSVLFGASISDNASFAVVTRNWSKCSALPSLHMALKRSRERHLDLTEWDECMRMQHHLRRYLCWFIPRMHWALRPRHRRRDIVIKALIAIRMNSTEEGQLHARRQGPAQTSGHFLRAYAMTRCVVDRHDRVASLDRCVLRRRVLVAETNDRTAQGVMLIAGLKHDANPSWGKICLHFHLVSISFKRPLHSDFVPVSVSFEQPFSVTGLYTMKTKPNACGNTRPVQLATASSAPFHMRWPSPTRQPLFPTAIPYR